MTEPKTHTLDVPGAALHYDVRSNDASTAPVLLLVGSPMGAAGFSTLAGHFADRTVVTYDPRGLERSERSDGATESTPDEHADDLHRLISALALVTRRPEQVRTLVAHEPPAAQVLPDREQALAACLDIQQTYERSGIGPAMAKFITLVGHKGMIPADFIDRPAPNPADFGLPTEDDGSRNDPLVGQNIISCTHYEHDFDTLRAAPTKVVIAAGAESRGEMANRAAVAMAERMGEALVTFPSDHAGFLGGEYGMTGDPDTFAATLRQVLTAKA